MSKVLFLKAITGAEFERIYNSMADTHGEPIASTIEWIKNSEGSTDILNAMIYYKESKKKNQLHKLQLKL